MSVVRWWHFVGLLGAEAVIAVACITLLCRFCRPAWQRTYWHGCLVILLGLFLIEGFGLRWTWHFPLRSAQPKVLEHKAAVEALPMAPLSEDIVVPVSIETPAALNTAPQIPPVAGKPLWWPGLVWFTGFGLLMLRSLGGRVLFLLRYPNRSLISDPVLLSCVSQLARRLEMRGPILVTKSTLLPGPIAFGVVRTQMCLPGRFAEMFTPAQQEAVLAHELEHLRAHDPFWYCLSDLVTALWWWNPVIWYARRKLQVATEQAADQTSVLVEDGPMALAECLVAMGKTLERHRSFNSLGIEGNGFRSGLGRRVSRLLQLRAGVQLASLKPWKTRIVYLGSVLVLVLCVVAGGAWSTGEKPLASAAWAALQVKPEPQRTARLDPLGSGSSVGETQINTEPSSRSDRLPKLKPQQKLVKQAKGDETLEPLDPEKPALYPWLTRGINEPLQTRWFKLDAARLQEKFPGGTNDASMRVFTNLFTVFNAEELDLSPPKNVFYNDRLAMLMVRGTRADLKRIENVLRGIGLLLGSSHLDEDLQTRWFNVDPERVARMFSEGPGISNLELVVSNLRTRLKKAGVDLIAYKDRRGMLMVRGTKEDLDVVERSIEELQSPVTQVLLEITVFEHAGETSTDGPRILGMLTRKQANVFRESAERSGFSLLTQSKRIVTNREVILIKFPWPTGPVYSPIDKANTNGTNLFRTVSVKPEVQADSFAIQLNALQSLQEFVGYNLNNRPYWDYVPSVGANPPPTYLQPDPTPTPIFQRRQATNRLTVWDGQTMVVGGLMPANHEKSGGISATNRVPLLGDLPLAGRIVPSAVVPKSGKQLTILITPTLVDDKGKPLHDQKDMPFTENSFPPQPEQVK
ncbi:MAG: Regulatory sensor-transducer, BlaR1/MecR1 family [Verrucomicrobiales bacterium]|nr:Regulatory sensor-transducer, BlaR1/MecR1 family [Verrucomicrobiales bacterium]